MNETSRRIGLAHPVVREAHVAELDGLPQAWQRLRARTFGHLRVGIEDLENALGRGHRLLQGRVHAAQLLDRRVHHERAATKAAKSPPDSALGDLTAAVPDQSDHREAAQQFHQRRQNRQRARDLQVGAIQALRGAPEPLLLVRFRPERLHDAVAGERFRRDVRQLLEVFLAPSRRAADPFAEAHKRIHDQRRARDRDQRQPRVL